MTDSTVASVTRLHRAPIASVQGALALDTTPRLDPPEVTVVHRTHPGDVVRVDPALRGRLDAWVRRYLQAVVEIVSGDRPVSQLLRWTLPEVYDDLGRRAVLVARAGGHSPGGGRGRHAVRPAVLGVRTELVREDALEASVHVRYGQLSRALAARFEEVRGRWQCVALEFS